MAGTRRAAALKRVAAEFAGEQSQWAGLVGERITVDCEDHSTLFKVGIGLAGVTLLAAIGGLLIA